MTVDNHVAGSEFNRLNHTEGLLLSRNRRDELGDRPTFHPHGISLNKKIAEVGLNHVPCPLRQNHVIIHSANTIFKIGLHRHWMY
jgi:hypothetical protein